MKTQQHFFLSLIVLKKQELCEIPIEVDPSLLYDIPNYLKTQKMCDDVVRSDPYSLQFVPDWFVTEEQIDIWYYDDEYCNDDELTKWWNDYQERKFQKAKIKEELILLLGIKIV